MADCLPRVIAFTPSGRLGGFFFEPGFEFLGSHVDELIKLSAAALVGLLTPGTFNACILNDGLVVFYHGGPGLRLTKCYTV